MTLSRPPCPFTLRGVSHHLATRQRELDLGTIDMKKKFKVGDRVTWNSEAEYVSGVIVAVHTRDVDYKGYTHHATENDPQYEIKITKTDDVAMRKVSARRWLWV